MPGIPLGGGSGRHTASEALDARSLGPVTVMQAWIPSTQLIFRCSGGNWREAIYHCRIEGTQKYSCSFYFLNSTSRITASKSANTLQQWLPILNNQQTSNSDEQSLHF